MVAKLLSEDDWFIVNITGQDTTDMYIWLNKHMSGEWVVTSSGLVGFEYDHEAMFFKLAFLQ